MKIITLENSLLRQKSNKIENINGNLDTFIEDMFRIMYKNKGIGLAAVQVGKTDRLFIAHIPEDKPRVFINPEMLETSIEENIYEEGCLSIPGVNANVKRPFRVKIQAWSIKGEPFTLTADNLLATVIQHELDHLNGKLFIDHLEEDNKK